MPLPDYVKQAAQGEPQQGLPDYVKQAMSDSTAGPIRPEKSISALTGKKMQQRELDTDIDFSPVTRTISNIPSSAGRLVKDIATPIMHPVDTAKAVGGLALGIAEKAIPGPQEHEKYADAVGQAIKSRYGSIEAFKETVQTDPVGVISDIAGLATGVGAGVKALSKAGSLASKTGSLVSKVASALDPATMVIKSPAKILKSVEPLVSNVFGVTTGAGAESLRQAAKSGAEGGKAGKAFKEHLRGIAPIQEIVEDTKVALRKMREDRTVKYREGMEGVKLDKTVLDFDPITSAIDEVLKIGSFKGKRIDRSASEVWGKITDVVDEWGAADPSQFHTPEGMDALKRAIGDVRDSAKYGTPERVVADRVYMAVKNQITKQAPEYSKVMKGYEYASDLIRDIEKTLSVSPTANVDTTVRKLQSVMRNNANTNYGRRADLAKILVDAGASELMPKIAGQALSSPTPRGLQALGATGGGIAALTTQPLALGGLAVASPRLMGEAAYLGGKASRSFLGKRLPPLTGQALRQSGRVEE